MYKKLNMDKDILCSFLSRPLVHNNVGQDRDSGFLVQLDSTEQIPSFVYQSKGHCIGVPSK